MSRNKKFISLSEFNPVFISEWHPTLNKNLTPNDISYGSAKKVWWICEKGHEWEQNPNHRSRGRGCPICAQESRKTSHSKKWIEKHGSLAEKNPELAKQWHPTKNGNKTAYDFSAGNGNKAWWICEKGHEWEAVISSRNQGIGCPICSGHKALLGYNDLSTVNPELSQQWHPTKNGVLKPSDVTLNCTKKIWWLGNCGHEWEVSVAHRAQGTGCPICAGKKVLKGYNDFATAYPELAKEWHPTKNGDLTADKVTPKSNKKIWWECARGHEWQTGVCHRTKGTGCPVCSGEIKTSFPEQVIFFYLKDITEAYNRYMIDKHTEIDVYLPEYRIGIEYDGLYYHNSAKSTQKEKKKEEKLKNLDIFLIRIKEADDKVLKTENKSVIYLSSRITDNELNRMIDELINRINQYAKINVKIDVNVSRDRGKIYEQYILGEKKKSLLALQPDLAKQWHPTKNGNLLPENVSVSANKRVWWICKEGHEWQAMIHSRSQGVGCPICAGKKVLSGYNDLLTKNPEIAKQWHPTKNGNLTAGDITAFSNKEYWWICKEGHEWKATASDRMSGKGCAVCSGHKVLVGYNDLETTHTELALQWHPTKNGNIKASDVTHGSDRKVWWLGNCGHEWEATISSRSLGMRCPYCSNQKVLVGFNDLVTNNHELALQWHPTKNGNRKSSDYTVGSNKKVWWICELGHEWEANIASRNSGRGCPYCSGKKLMTGFNDLSTRNPRLAKEWHPINNGELTPEDVMPGSNKIVWWMCEKGHEWKNSVNVRNSGNNCPYCANQLVWVGYNDLSTVNPRLASQWHPTKNGDRNPTEYTAGSNKKAWWICELGHEWESTISSRNKGAGCEKCYRLRRKNKI